MITEEAQSRLRRLTPILGVSLVAYLARLPFILAFPTGGGDSDVYMTVAQNILSGCGVSLSDPASGLCVPHFGGNQGPGYPFFMAVVWLLSGHADMAVRLVQAAILAGAIGFATWALAALLESRGAGLALGLVLALSPLELAWPRYLQTETLALAAVICFFAVVLLSIRDGRVRIVAIGCDTCGRNVHSARPDQPDDSSGSFGLRVARFAVGDFARHDRRAHPSRALGRLDRP